MASSKNYDWDAIALAYSGGMPMIELSQKFNINLRMFYYHTEKMGWPRRTGENTDKRLRFQRKHLLQRAYTIITRKMIAVDERIENVKNLTTLEANREAYTLRTLISLLEQLMIFEKQIREEETQTTGDNNDKAEHLRSSLAERLTRLETEPD